MTAVEDLAPIWRVTLDGVTISVKVQPKSRRPGVHGKIESATGPCLRIGVAEPPEDGKANRAVCALLAAALDVPARDVTVTQGRASRDKIVSVTGDGVLLSRKLESL